MTVSINLSGYEAGSYVLEPVVDQARYPDLSFRIGAIAVTLTDIEPERTGAADTTQEDNE